MMSCSAGGPEISPTPSSAGRGSGLVLKIAYIAAFSHVPRNHNRNVTEIRLWALPEAITRGPQGPA